MVQTQYFIMSPAAWKGVKERFSCLATAKELKRNGFFIGNGFSGRTGEHTEREPVRLLVPLEYFCAVMCSPSQFLHET